MLKEHKKALARIFTLIDLLILNGCIPLPLYVWNQDIELRSIGLAAKLFQPLMLSSLLWIYLSRQFDLYSSKRFSLLRDECLQVSKVAVICLALTLAVFAHWHPSTLRYAASVLVLQIVFLTTLRAVLRKTLGYLRKMGYNYRQILLVGCNERSATLFRELEASAGFGIRILGYIDAPNGHRDHKVYGSLKPLGKLEDIQRILTEQIVDEVFVTLPIKSFYEEIEYIIRVCETVGVEVKIPTDLFNVGISKSVISKYSDLPFIDLYTSPKIGLQLLIKRFIDLLASFTLVVIVLPSFAVIALLIKATSKGPVFFTQERVGYNGRLFRLYKFRTMVENAEQMKKDLESFNEMDGPVFKIKNDPRITGVGRFLRKTSIDELPQLFNVLKGEMSLVGPRPPLPSEVVQYDLKDRRRLSVKPGITGIWQVCGRNCIPFDKWMEMDRQYIDEWCLWLDIKILAKTLPAVLKGTGSA